MTKKIRALSAQQWLWLVFVTILFLPTAGYFVINGYWWLFDGGDPDSDKMYAAAIGAVLSGWFVFAWAKIEDIWWDL